MKQTALARRKGLARTAGPQPGCGKKRYPDELAAKLALLEISARRDSGGRHENRQEKRVQPRCSQCGGFHLTSTPKRGGRKRMPETVPAGMRLRPRRAGQPEPFPPAARTLIDGRDVSLLDPGRCCQRCAGTQGLQYHHRRGKASGGSRRRPHAHCACNGILLCLRCHAHVHAHPEQARAEGFIVSQSVRRPGTKGVMRFAAAGGGAAQWPSCAGEWRESAPEMAAAA